MQRDEVNNCEVCHIPAFYLFFDYITCSILVPQPGIEPVPPPV